MSNKYAVVENGIVVNVAVADEEFAAQQGWIKCDRAEVGWTYQNGVFVEPPIAPPTTPTTPTKEELAAQLQALQAQIQALE